MPQDVPGQVQISAAPAPPQIRDVWTSEIKPSISCVRRDYYIEAENNTACLSKGIYWRPYFGARKVVVDGPFEPLYLSCMKLQHFPFTVRSGDYDLPADDHNGLFVTTFPTPPSYTASSVSCKSGEMVTSGSMAHKAIATVLQR